MNINHSILPGESSRGDRALRSSCRPHQIATSYRARPHDRFFPLSRRRAAADHFADARWPVLPAGVDPEQERLRAELELRSLSGQLRRALDRLDAALAGTVAGVKGD